MPRRALTFVDGLGAGIAAIALLPLIYFALRGDAFAAMYRDLGGPLPLTTRIVLHPAWRISAPCAVATLGTLLLLHPPRFRHALLIVAILSILAAAVTYVAAYRPIWMLAGNIH